MNNGKSSELYKKSDRLIGEIDETLEQLFPEPEEGDKREMFSAPVNIEPEFWEDEIEIELERLGIQNDVSTSNYSAVLTPAEAVNQYLEELSLESERDRISEDHIEALEESRHSKMASLVTRLALTENSFHLNFVLARTDLLKDL